MTTVNRSMGLLDWSLLIALSVLWGGSFFFIGVAVDALPPFTIVALRVGLAAAALNVIVPALGLIMPKNWRHWLAFLEMGALNNVIPFSLIVWGQTHITGGLASILNATTPFFTVVVAHFLTSDEKLTGERLAGVLIGFLGVVFVIGPQALKGLGVNTLAQLAVLGAAISYAFAATFGRRFRRAGLAPLVTAAGQVTASSVLMLPLALIVDRPWRLPIPHLEVWGAVVGLALLSTALAYILYFRILAAAGATNLALVTLLIPVSAILLNTMIRGEHLDMRHIGGMGILGLGLVVVDGRLFRFRRRAGQPAGAPNERTESPRSTER